MAQANFPPLTAETLSGNKVTFPDVVKGQKALLVVAFERQAQSQADAWYDAYVKSFQPKGFVFYELPMISGLWKWMSGWIDSGMRSGVPSYKHDNVATYYGPLDAYYEAFGVTNKSVVYVLSLDEQGRIAATTSGSVTDAKLKALLQSK